VNLLHDGYERFQREVARRNLRLPLHGSWQVAVVFAGDVPKQRLPDENFLNLVNASNPRYSGWPVWVDSRGFADDTSHPYVFERGWEAFIFHYERGGVLRDHIDFWRAESIGRFYLYRALQDDLAIGPRNPEPMTTLDFGLVILRTAEAIAVPMAFARAMALTPEETTLYFAFRWSGLRDRELSAWANPERFVSPGYVCRQAEVTSGVAVPLDTPIPAIARFVRDATAELFASFNGFTPGLGVVEDLSAQLLNRDL
jgi:hypothetical protein